MAFAFNLAAVPVKLIAIPLLAGLAAGTGALGAYVAAPPVTPPASTAVAALPSIPPAPVAAEQAAAPVKPDAKPSCEQQTWPYLDNRCIARSNAKRNIRVVMAPRAGEATPSAATASLVTSDTVLRGRGVAPEVSEQPAVKKPAKRSETGRQRGRDGFNRVYSVYSVPSGESAKPVIVVRPLPLTTYSSRY